MGMQELVGLVVVLAAFYGAYRLIVHYRNKESGTGSGGGPTDGTKPK